MINANSESTRSNLWQITRVNNYHISYRAGCHSLCAINTVNGTDPPESRVRGTTDGCSFAMI